MRDLMSMVRAGRKILATGLALLLALQPLAAQDLDTGAKMEIAARNAIAMQRSLQALEDGLADVPRDRWDPHDVVDTIGIDAPLLYSFLRSRTRWVPYPGALRGPVGVLMDQRGNSLDQSLLLARLYELAGFEVRLAHGILDDATLDGLLAAWREPAGGAVAASLPAGPVPAESPTELATTYDLQPDVIEAALQVSADKAGNVGTRLNELVSGQVSAVAAALGTLPSEREKAVDESLLRQSLADHWWVEVNDKGWQAADPLEPTATFGTALTKANETLAPGDLPDDLWHHVTIRLVIEQAKDGKALTGTVLEQKVRAADMIGRVVRLDHYPTQWPSTWPSTTPSNLQTKLRAALATQKEWLPTLAIGEEEFNQGSIKDSGEINLEPTPINPFAVIGVPVAGDISKVVDALSMPGEAGQVVPGEATTVGDAGELTAEWLDFTIERPGLPPEEIRRTLFDIAGPAFRARGDYSGLKLDDKDRFDRSMAMLGQVQAMILPAAPPAEQILARQAEKIVENKPILDEIAKDPFGEIPGNIVELLGKMKPVPVVLDGFVGARFSQSPVGDAVYLDKPMIVALHNELARDRNTGDFTTQAALDIVSSGVAVDALSGVEPFKARLVQGVHDTLTEALALGGGGPDVINAAIAFEQDQYGWTLIRDKADPQLASLDPDFAARLEADLSSGALVLVPPKAEKGREVWWKIDPRTGETLGYGPKGWGTSLVEYAFVLVIKTLLSQIACMASTAAIDAGMNAFETGNPNLPKNWNEVKEGAKKYAKTCVSQAMLAQLTGISTTFLMNGASSLNRAIEGGLRSRYGTDPYWEARKGGGQGLGGVGPPPPAGGAGGPPAGPPGGPPPGNGGKEPPGGPPPGSGPPEEPAPGSGRVSEAEAQAAHERAVDAQKRAYDAKARMDANPSPENRQAYEDAMRNYDAAMQERLNAWSRSGSDGYPPQMPTPSNGISPKAQTGINPAANDGKGQEAKAPGDPASGARPDVGPDIPRGLPPKPDGYQYGQKDIDEWTARAAEANRRAAEAGSRYEANPTPENQAAYEQALNNLGNAEQNRLEAWSKGGRKGDLSSAPPPSPAPSSSGSSGVDPFGKTGVQSTQPDGKPNPAVQPTAPMPATGNSASGAGPDVGPDIPRGLPPKPDGYQYGQKDIDEWTARAAEANRRAAEAGSRYEANPTPENQAAYEQALNNLGNAEQNRLEAWSKGGRKGDLSSAPPPSPAPSSSGSSGVDPFEKTGVQSTQPDGKPNPAVQPTLPLPATGGSGGASTVDPLGQTGVQTTQPDGRPNPALQPTLPLPASGSGEVGSSMVDPLGQTGLQQKLPDGRPNPALANTVPGTAGGFGGAGAGAGDVLSPAANSVPPAGLPQPAPSSGKTNPGLGLGATQGYNNLLLGLSGLGSAVKP